MDKTLNKAMNEEHNTECHIFAGHYGSGKTELAVNEALKLRAEGKSVTLVDMDTVNPYFRSADARGILTAAGVRLTASEFAATNVDMPTVPAAVKGVFTSSDAVIFDIGGDDDGAWSLGGYKAAIKNVPYQMHLVVNARRPLSRTAEELAEYKSSIERACGLEFTDIINNTNTAELTDADAVREGAAVAAELSRISGLVLAKTTVTAETLAKLGAEVPEGTEVIEMYIKKPWQ